MTRRSRLLALAALLAAGLALRIVMLAGNGYHSDISAIAAWAHDVARDGLGGYYAAGGTSDYPVLLYLLWPIGALLPADAMPLAVRMLSIPADLAIGLLLYGALVRRSEGVASWAAGLYLLNPAILVAGPLWGQIDSLAALPLLGCLFATSSRRVALAGALGTLALITKPQFGIGLAVLVVLVLFERRRAAIGPLAAAALSGVATTAAVFIPLGLGLGQYWRMVEHVASRSRLGSLQALNMWAIPAGFGAPEGRGFLIGVVLLIAAGLAALLILRWRRDLTAILATAAFLALAEYFLPTRVHERYLFPAVVLLAPLAALHERLRPAFTALSLGFAVSLLYVLARAGAFTALLGGRQLLPQDLPLWSIRLAAVSMIGVGAWCAWGLIRLLRSGPIVDPEAP